MVYNVQQFKQYSVVRHIFYVSCKWHETLKKKKKKLLNLLFSLGCTQAHLGSGQYCAFV